MDFNYMRMCTFIYYFFSTEYNLNKTMKDLPTSKPPKP